MGAVELEVVIGEESRFWGEFPSEGLNDFIFSQKHVQSLDKIWKILIAKDIVVIKTEDRDFRNGAQFAPIEKDDRSENNICAYDWDGNFLWNIGQIVGDIKLQFDGFAFISHASAQEEYQLVLSEDCGTLIRCIACAWVFIVDVTNRRLLLNCGTNIR